MLGVRRDRLRRSVQPIWEFWEGRRGSAAAHAYNPRVHKHLLTHIFCQPVSSESRANWSSTHQWIAAQVHNHLDFLISKKIFRDNVTITGSWSDADSWNPDLSGLISEPPLRLASESLEKWFQISVQLLIPIRLCGFPHRHEVLSWSFSVWFLSNTWSNCITAFTPCTVVHVY